LRSSISSGDDPGWRSGRGSEVELDGDDSLLCLDFLTDRGLPERLLREEAEGFERDAVVFRLEEPVREATELAGLSDDGVGEGFPELLAELLGDDVTGIESGLGGFVTWSEGAVGASRLVGVEEVAPSVSVHEFCVDGFVRQASSAK
jgi:hypothetical protein